MSRKILIDTFNSGLAQPAGIGTLARSLADAHHRLGDQVFLLTEAALSPRLAAGAGPAGKSNGALSSADSVVLFDHFGAQRRRPQPAEAPPWYIKNRLFSARGLARRLAKPADGAAPADGFARAPARLVDELHAIELRPVRRRLGYFDRIVNSSDLFRHALLRFQQSRQPTMIELPVTVDVAHFTYCLPIKARNARKNIYTICDLIPLRYPYLTMDDKAAYYDMLRWCCDNADLIVTISEHSRREIIELLGAPADRVVNTHLPVDVADDDMLPPGQIESALHGLFGIRRAEYFLLAGAIEPRKNVARAIEAHLTASTEFPLVICGPRTPLSEAELALLENPALRQQRDRHGRKVMVLDYLPRNLLLLLMAGARAVLLPSISEGFGLSGLEAMSFGTPVIASNAGALPEVYGDAAAIYVDPYSTAELREAIDRMARLGAAELDGLRSRSLDHAKRYSFDSYCARLRDLHAKLGAA